MYSLFPCGINCHHSINQVSSFNCTIWYKNVEYYSSTSNALPTHIFDVITVTICIHVHINARYQNALTPAVTAIPVPAVPVAVSTPRAVFDFAVSSTFSSLFDPRAGNGERDETHFIDTLGRDDRISVGHGRKCGVGKCSCVCVFV